MKHVSSPTEADALLDLSKPSLEALSFLLRHREMWPKGFVWHYGGRTHCAMGLAHNLWEIVLYGHMDGRISAADEIDKSARLLAGAFAIDEVSAARIFWNAGVTHSCYTGDVTPEMVTDDIDAHLKANGQALARSSIFGQV